MSSTSSEVMIEPPLRSVIVLASLDPVQLPLGFRLPHGQGFLL